MSILSQDQINTLKNKGLTDEKIAALAASKGMELPKTSFWKGVGQSLIKSEKGFGQSIAGAMGGIAPKGSLMRRFTGQESIDKANEMNQQVTSNLINKIKEKREAGQDTTRLMEALKTLDKEVNFYDILNVSTGGSLDKSAKQVFGEGLGVATDILGAGALPGGISTATKATTIGQGIKTGAKAGAIGGSIFGAAKGATGAMQEDLSGAEIAGRAVGGGIAGGVIGGAVGGVTGGIAGAIRGHSAKVSAREGAFAKQLVSEKPTDLVKQQALKEGRVTESGLLKASKILPSKRDEKIAESVRGLVSSKKSAIQNLKSIDDTVRELNTGLKAYVAENKVPFNTNQLRTQLNNGKADLKVIFASDKTAEKTYDAVVDEFVKLVKNKDTRGLMDARQAFDKIPAIKKLLDSQGLAENVRREVVHTARDQANKFVASLLPKNNEYAQVLLRESNMIRAIENIAAKNSGNIGMNNLQILTTRYPALKWVVGGLVGAAGVGVGSAIIGSTD